jgi:hypothetical protein
MFKRQPPNKENERFARPTETQPVAPALCTCWRCAVPRPVLLQLENLVSIDLRLPPPFKRVKWWDQEPVEERRGLCRRVQATGGVPARGACNRKSGVN